MGFKEKTYKFIMSIPHIALLWDMRRYPRYEPLKELDIEIRNEDLKIHALLVDICTGGMRIVSTDKRIENAKSISLIVDDFCVTLPCQKIRKTLYYYGIIFGSMDKRECSKLAYFIDHFTRDPENPGLTEIMK
jgi:hypothetical protein